MSLALMNPKRETRFERLVNRSRAQQTTKEGESIAVQLDSQSADVHRLIEVISFVISKGKNPEKTDKKLSYSSHFKSFLRTWDLADEWLV